jgi:RNA polymerase sigma factor (sigma-70 family)
MRTDDGFLVSKCLEGDSAAFGILVDKYKAGVYALAYSRLHNFHDAEDIAQEAFLEAYKRLHTLRRWDRFSAWIYSITNNLCKNFIRSKSSRPDREYIEDQEPLLMESHSSESYQSEQVSNFLHDSLNSLPEIYQNVLSLHYLGGLSSDEIANVIGVPPATVRQRLSRGRTLLKNEILESATSTLESKKLKADFTFEIVESVKRINITPKPFGLPWGLSLVSFATIAIFGIFTPINFTQSINNIDGLSPSGKVMISKKADYQIPVQIVKIQKTNRFSLFKNFDDADVSDWIGGYYEGTVDLNNKRLGKPIIKTSSKAARTGKYGLLFTKNRESGSSCTVSSPEFGPLKKRFQVDLDFILFDKYQHIIYFGENAPFETYNEKMISCFGVSFDNNLIFARTKGGTRFGYYNPDEFYHITMVADPVVNRFDITITGNLRDLNGNPVNKLSMQNLEFEYPITDSGIRRLNLYTGTRLSSDIRSVSMGIDNVVINTITK